MSATTTGSNDNATHPYHKRTNDDVVSLVRIICNTSNSEDEVRRRVKEELNYPYSMMIAGNEPGRFMVMLWSPLNDGSTLTI